MAAERARFRTMDEGTAHDYALIDAAEASNNLTLVPRLLDLLNDLGRGEQGYPITRLEHSLQAATRAFRDGRDVGYVVATLFHDVGDGYAPYSHGAFASAIIEPFVDERTAWIVRVHPAFQMAHYAPFMGGTKTARDRYRDHPWFGDAVEFCAKYDANSFDADYPSLPLEDFLPMVNEVFGREPAAQGIGR